MARPHIPEEVSSYYPPRARWNSGIVCLVRAIRRWLALDRLTFPSEMKIGEMVAGFFVPGLAVWLRGPRPWGQAALTGSAWLFFIFIVWLGSPVANLAFGLLISLHCTGFVYYCNPLMAHEPLRSRLAFTILVLLAMGLGFYLPVQHAIQTHWLMPLRNGSQVIIVAAGGQPTGLKLGDWAAFKTDDGVVFGPIMGLGGDHVDSITVPAYHWLIRQQFARRYYHDGSPISFSSDTFVQLTIVSQEEFVGKPLHRWFWRKQILP